MTKKKVNELALRDAPISMNMDAHISGASIFEQEDPDSIINRTNGLLRGALERARESPRVTAIINYNEKVLRESLKPDPADTRLRISFWEEYGRSVDSGAAMRIERIFAGIVAKETFITKYLGNDDRLGYLLNIPPNYERATQEILMTAMERLRDILELPLVNKKGQVQSAVIAGILKAADMLDKRVHGANLQRIAIHQHSTSGSAAQIPGETLAMDELAILEKQITDVRSRMGKVYAQIPGANGDVKVVVERASVAEGEVVGE